MGMGFYTYFCKEIRSKTMPNKTLIKQLLRVKNIVIDSYKYCAEDDRFTISVHPTKGTAVPVSSMPEEMLILRFSRDPQVEISGHGIYKGIP
jgi:prephenate dehydrogenase